MGIRQAFARVEAVRLIPAVGDSGGRPFGRSHTKPTEPTTEYDGLRRALLQFFDWRGIPAPDACSDVVLARLAAKVSDTPVRDIRGCAYGIARLVALERQEAAFTPFRNHAAQSSWSDAPAAEPCRVVRPVLRIHHGTQQMNAVESARARGYLLGTVNEDERALIERDYFSDEGALDRVTTAETDLIEDYLARRLTPHDRWRFEHAYLASPGHRARVDTVRRRTASAARKPKFWLRLVGHLSGVLERMRAGVSPGWLAAGTHVVLLASAAALWGSRKRTHAD
jgi:hypothetical protein